MSGIFENSKSGSKRSSSTSIEETVPPRKKVCASQASSKGSTTAVSDQPQFLRLPPEVVESIFLKIGSYAEVARLRSVCRHFNTTGQRILTKGFNGIQNTVQSRLHVIKAQMPRRESSRRKHPLARECDIMETLHMRLVLMQMTFGKHIEKGHCCFFAGEILDEIMHIVRYTRSAAVLGRVYKVTDELFDLSTMAMEYFKERIEPNLPQVSYFSTDLPIPPSTPLTYTTVLQRPTAGPSCISSTQSQSISDPEIFRPISLKQQHSQSKVAKMLRKHIRKANADVAVLKREIRTSKAKMIHQNRQLKEYANRLEQHEKRFEEQAKKMEELTKELGEFKSKIERISNEGPSENG